MKYARSESEQYPVAEIETHLLCDYFRQLVNQFFKILPMRENGETTLGVYLVSLRSELIGLRNLPSSVDNNASLISLLSILQFLIDHPDCAVSEVRREVFRAIELCNRISAACGARGKQKGGDGS